MIIRAHQFTIFVKDLDEAKQFYTEALGFVVRHDIEFRPGWRYLTVAPSPDNETVLELKQAVTSEQLALVGKQASDHGLVMFISDDIERDYHDMKARGVIFDGEPVPVPGGRGVGFTDLYGNHLDMYEPARK